MNWLDNAINWWNPEAGLRRARARAQREVLLSYEAARSGRRQGGWFTSGTSGNAEMGPALVKVRDNAEDLVQNNAFARKAVRRWRRRVVGYGITPQAATGNPDLNRRIDKRWAEWALLCSSDVRTNIYAEQSRIVRTAFVRGECLIRLWDRLPGDGLPIPFQIQVLEPDYLDTAKTEQIQSGYIIHGVQFDSLGRIQGYWLFGQHPGDVVQTSARGLMSRFVPANLVLHHVPLERPGDVRGMGRFAPVIAKLRDVDEYSDAEIVRKKIEACVAMFVEAPEGPENGAGMGPITDQDGKKTERFSPGMIVRGNSGQKPHFFAPTPSGDFASHKKTEIREVAAGLDQPYVILAEDLEAVNYSSFRGGAIDERDSVDEYRWLWFIPQVMDPIWRKFIDTLVLMGELPEPNYGVKWNPPPFDLLDRKAEAEADEMELRLGKTTWPQFVGAQAQDPEKQIAEIAAWKKRLADAGVDFSAKGKLPQPQQQQEQQGGNDGTSATSTPAA